MMKLNICCLENNLCFALSILHIIPLTQSAKFACMNVASFYLLGLVNPAFICHAQPQNAAIRFGLCHLLSRSRSIAFLDFYGVSISKGINDTILNTS